MNHDLPTIAETLSAAAARLAVTSPTPRLDAELLLGHILGWSRARILAERNQPLSHESRALFQRLLARREQREPIAYLSGHREFFGLDLEVTSDVLVPRPETELLVERALLLAAEISSQTSASLRIADIGTGSGAIIIALASQLPNAILYAVDLSPAALAVAQRNARRHQVFERIQFLQGDLLAPLPQPVQLLVSNPPYTILSEIDEGVRRHEPCLALDGGPDGLDLYRRLLRQAPQSVLPGGAILLEIGESQARDVTALAQAAFPDATISCYQDLAGLDRLIEVRLASPHSTA